MKITPPRVYNRNELTFFNLKGKVEVHTNDNSAAPILTSFEYEDTAFPGIDDLVVDKFNKKYHDEQYIPNTLHELELNKESSNLIWKRDADGQWLTRDFTTKLIGDSRFVIATPKVCTMIQLRKDFTPDTINCYLYIHKVGTLSNNIDVYRDVGYQETIKYEKGGPESPPEFLITDTKLYWINFVLD